MRHLRIVEDINRALKRPGDADAWPEPSSEFLNGLSDEIREVRPDSATGGRFRFAFALVATAALLLPLAAFADQAGDNLARREDGVSFQLVGTDDDDDDDSAGGGYGGGDSDSESGVAGAYGGGDSESDSGGGVVGGGDDSESGGGGVVGGGGDDSDSGGSDSGGAVDAGQQPLPTLPTPTPPQNGGGGDDSDSGGGGVNAGGGVDAGGGGDDSEDSD
jgi:hypothetical protein